MKFDKDIVFAVIFCAAVLLGWQPFAVYMGWMPENTPVQKIETATPAPAVPAKSAAAAAVNNAALPLKNPEAEAVVRLDNDKMIFAIRPVDGAVQSITLKNYLTADRKGDIVADQRFSAAGGAKGIQPGALSVFSGSEEWRTAGVEQQRSADGRAYTLQRRMVRPDGRIFVLTQKFSLGGGYASREEVTFTNPSAESMTLPGVTVSGGELQNWHFSSGDKVRSDSVRFDYMTASGDFEDIDGDAKDSKFFRSGADNVEWVALSNKYFINILKASQPFHLFQARMPVQDDRCVISGGARYPELSIPANSSVTLSFDFYAGPKMVSQLQDFAPGADRTMHLSWGPMDYLARLMLWALVKLDSICGSYGWSIIILTVIVRLLFWPVTAKANASMKRMSAVQPRIKELREKYKDNPQMLNAKMMELYRNEKINPMGGCLPILLQIPVFFALYATLGGAVELRQVSFWWADDLAAADTVAVLFGVLPVNPLVIAMTLLMVLQQRLTPSAMEPMQQKMMLFMPVIMLFFLYDLPSGLTLYWTVSQIFSIIQLLVQQRKNKKTTVPAAPSVKG